MACNSRRGNIPASSGDAESSGHRIPGYGCELGTPFPPIQILEGFAHCYINCSGTLSWLVVLKPGPIHNDPLRPLSWDLQPSWLF